MTHLASSTDAQEIKQRVASILGLDELSYGSWDILSNVPDAGLYLVHYKTDPQGGTTVDLNRYGDLRGVIVDINAGVVVCRSFGHTPTAVASQLTPDNEGMITLRDTSGHEHVIDSNAVKIKPGFEGTIMRVFLHEGKVRRATHRRINPINSRWGDSINFNDMYDRLGGPSNDDLFDTSKRYSPFVHIFLMVHPDVLSCTKQNVGVGYIVYLGAKQMWSIVPEESPYPFEQVDTVVKVPAGVSSIPAQITQPVMVSAFDWSIEQANQHLRWGFFEPFEDDVLTDRRLGTGEFVMLYKYDTEGRIGGLLKVASPAYQWRCDVRDNNPNILHRLYQLINASYIPANTVNGYRDFLAKFPIIHPYEPDTIIQNIHNEGPRTLWTQPPIDSSMVITKDERLYNVWVCLMMSVPLHLQVVVADAYNQLITERGRVVEWLRHLYDSDAYQEDVRLPDRAKAIINQGLKFAREKTNRGQNRDRYGRIMSMEMMTRDNIRNLISKEEGGSLYRLVRAMNEAGKVRNENRTITTTQ